MQKPLALTTPIVVVAVAAAALAGCGGPKPYVREGDANSVEITYAGDVAAATAVARAYCARYEKLPQLKRAGSELAEFACVKP